MSTIRSISYDFLQTIITVAFLLVFSFLLLMPSKALQCAIRTWARVIWLLSIHILGMKVRVLGMENIPTGPVLVASKHQSAWDTAVFFLFFPNSVYVLKKELLSLPLWGMYAKKYGVIAVDREGGGASVKKLIADTKGYLSIGRSVIIFPEGTRVRPGTRQKFHPGVAAIYKNINVPTIPVALNSGTLWGRRAIGMKRPGTITIKFLPQILPGLKRKDFMEKLHTDINQATEQLEREL